ncbi:TPA: hypothetical protein M4K80_000511 [Salmonella enterica]|nr:hypothetical protein [Salmonella enterica]
MKIVQYRIIGRGKSETGKEREAYSCDSVTKKQNPAQWPGFNIGLFLF